MSEVRQEQGLSKKAVKLLREVIQSIWDEPLRFNMSWFGKRLRVDDFSVPVENWPACGSVGCVAGHCVWVRRPRTFLKWISDPAFDSNKAIWGEAIRLLGITEAQADRLFYLSSQSIDGGGYWPGEYEAAYKRADRARNPRAMAAVAAARIEHFIKTDGRE